MGELEHVNEELGLGLHRLALEDAVMGRQRAKIELYGRDVFVVLKTLQLHRGDLGRRDRRAHGARRRALRPHHPPR